MNEQHQALDRILSLVEEAGCQQYLILIGSWVEMVYKEGKLLSGFNPNIHTLDVDFLIRNLRLPNPPAHLLELARQKGFLTEADRLNGTTKLFDPSGLEVEFLINSMGAGVEVALKTNIGVTAQALRHLDILLHNTVTASCLGHSVVVPIPEAYVLHKMVINSQRKAKTEKDAEAILNLWPYINRTKLEELMLSLTKKEVSRVIFFLDTYGLSVNI